MPIRNAKQESNNPEEDTQFDQRHVTNPYASTGNFEPEGISSSVVEVSPARLATTLFVWTVVCSLSAAPSFIIAIGQIARNQSIAMVLGIVIFIGIYSAADLLTRERPFRKDSRMRTILRSTFIIRSIMVAIFPIATVTDVILGMVSVSLVQAVSGPFHVDGEYYQNTMSFGATLATTLVQGCLLSVLLFLLGLLIAAIIFVTRSLMNRV